MNTCSTAFLGPVTWSKRNTVETVAHSRPHQHGLLSAYARLYRSHHIRSFTVSQYNMKCLKWSYFCTGNNWILPLTITRCVISYHNWSSFGATVGGFAKVQLHHNTPVSMWSVVAMAQKCCAPGGMANYDNSEEYTSVFRFPTDEQRQQQMASFHSTG